MNSRTRQFILRYYWVIFLLALVGATLAFARSSRSLGDLALCVSVVGSVYSFFLVVQKQASEDLQLFRALFREFNGRYKHLNEPLNRIKRARDLAPGDEDLVYDYFNLCAEEYWYYRQGYIPHEVWQSWRNGMREYFNAPAIRRVWVYEQAKTSYYGLPFEDIAEH